MIQLFLYILDLGHEENMAAVCKALKSPALFYLQGEDNGIIGISEAEKLNDKIDLYYIETNQSGKFKYAGKK